MPFDENIMEEFIRRITQLENDQENQSVDKKRFEILNLNVPAAQITANQNNYDIGDYDFFLVATDVSRDMTGFSGGVDGRVLWIKLSPASSSMVFKESSGSSDVGNQIQTITGGNSTLSARETAIFVYAGFIGKWLQITIL